MATVLICRSCPSCRLSGTLCQRNVPIFRQARLLQSPSFRNTATLRRCFQEGDDGVLSHLHALPRNDRSQASPFLACHCSPPRTKRGCGSAACGTSLLVLQRALGSLEKALSLPRKNGVSSAASPGREDNAEEKFIRYNASGRNSTQKRAKIEDAFQGVEARSILSARVGTCCFYMGARFIAEPSKFTDRHYAVPGWKGRHPIKESSGSKSDQTQGNLRFQRKRKRKLQFSPIHRRLNQLAAIRFPFSQLRLRWFVRLGAHARRSRTTAASPSPRSGAIRAPTAAAKSASGSPDKWA